MISRRSCSRIALVFPCSARTKRLSPESSLTWDTRAVWAVGKGGMVGNGGNPPVVTDSDRTARVSSELRIVRPTRVRADMSMSVMRRVATVTNLPH